jgi:hypothetical protein
MTIRRTGAVIGQNRMKARLDELELAFCLRCRMCCMYVHILVDNGSS